MRLVLPIIHNNCTIMADYCYLPNDDTNDDDDDDDDDEKYRKTNSQTNISYIKNNIIVYYSKPDI